MTIQEFQIRYHTEWRTMLSSPMGQAAMEALHDARMLPVCDAQPHQAHYRLGGISGYEMAEKNVILLSSAPRLKPGDAPQNYGVSDKPAE